MCTPPLGVVSCGARRSISNVSNLLAGDRWCWAVVTVGVSRSCGSMMARARVESLEGIKAQSPNKLRCEYLQRSGRRSKLGNFNALRVATEDYFRSSGHVMTNSGRRTLIQITIDVMNVRKPLLSTSAL